MVYLFQKNKTYLNLEYPMFPYYKEVTSGDVLTGYTSRQLASRALEEVLEKIETSRYADATDEQRCEHLKWLEDVIFAFMDTDSYLELCQENGFLIEMEGES